MHNWILSFSVQLLPWHKWLFCFKALCTSLPALQGIQIQIQFLFALVNQITNCSNFPSINTKWDRKYSWPPTIQTPSTDTRTYRTKKKKSKKQQKSTHTKIILNTSSLITIIFSEDCYLMFSLTSLIIDRV